MKKRVLFVCTHNSARSIMAEAFLKNMAGDRYEVESAGLEPGILNPLVVEVMKEEGIDISDKKPQSVFDLYKQGRRYHYVITVCDASQSAKCPIFPSALETIHWSFPDPASFEGSQKEKLEQTRKVRDAIKSKIEDWIKDKK
ncbi:MAG: arsenate reductase ArsC [Candidatus Omnitrophica bacterium]|nr:arsenate reductase ArsC [Candidatus Omnitrophota bacterium]